jgi:hypothetical protein
MKKKTDHSFPHPKSIDEKDLTNNWAPQEDQNVEKEIKCS